MEENEIIAAIIGKLSEPSDAIFTFTMRDLVTAIVRRRGVRAIDLSPSDIMVAREEVQGAISHYMDEREFVEIGLDAWEIIRNGELKTP